MWVSIQYLRKQFWWHLINSQTLKHPKSLLICKSNWDTSEKLLSSYFNCWWRKKLPLVARFQIRKFSLKIVRGLMRNESLVSKPRGSHFYRLGTDSLGGLFFWVSWTLFARPVLLQRIIFLLNWFHWKFLVSKAVTHIEQFCYFWAFFPPEKTTGYPYF